jgi:hypothetical protein
LVEDSAVSATAVKHHMLGYSDNVSKTTYSFLNPVETAFDWSAAADQVVAISTSTDDDVAGIGALTLSIDGLTAGHVSVATETITMTGTTITVAAGSDFSRVNNVKVATVGSNADSGLSNSGIITVTRDAAGDHIATIPIGMGIAPMGIFSVPSTQNWCLSSINVQGEQKREFNVRVMVRENATASGPYMLYQTILMGTQSLISGTNTGKYFLFLFLFHFLFFNITKLLFFIILFFTEFDIPAQSDVWVTATQKSGQTDGEVRTFLLLFYFVVKLFTNSNFLLFFNFLFR